MLENLNETGRLNVCTAIYEGLDEATQEDYGGKQEFLEACIKKGIEFAGENEEESRTLKLAESITRMADSLDELLKTGINRKLLILYIHDKIGRDIGKTKIEMVLDAIEEFIKETKKGG